jgi:acyl-coenzyme A synthetase/AMP-(fatty) acid ligase
MSTVFVFGLQGEPLNPCHPARARQLVRKQRAEVVSTRPYAIRLVPQESPACATTRPNHPIRLFDEA